MYAWIPNILLETLPYTTSLCLWVVSLLYWHIYRKIICWDGFEEMRWIIVLLLGAVGTFFISNIVGVQTIGNDTRTTGYCERVVDGDTIEVSVNGVVYKVRYIGIDTPETVDPRRPVGYFGKEASAKNTELVLGKVVRMEKDISDMDKYGRYLRYVYVDDLMINKELVRLGYAKVSTYPPDVKYVTVFLNAEREARDNKRGLWSE